MNVVNEGKEIIEDHSTLLRLVENINGERQDKMRNSKNIIFL